MAVVLAQNPFNPLIAKSEVGRAKQCSNSLPSGDHAFGKPNAVDSENARRVTSSWLEHVPSKKRVDSASVDFLRLNGSAARIPKVIQAIAAKIKERQLKAQAEGDKVTPKTETECREELPDRRPSLLKDRASFKDIIQNKFGNQGEEASMARYKDYHDQKLAQSRVKTTIRPTKASSGRSSVVEAQISASNRPPSPLFKLTKFTKIPSRYHISQK